MRQIKDVRTAQTVATAAEWTQLDPILVNGEIGVEEDTGRFKIGNGVSPWHLLKYYLDEDGVAVMIASYLDEIQGGTIDPRIGNLNTLTTEAKGTLVESINEINAVGFSWLAYYQSKKLG